MGHVAEGAATVVRDFKNAKTVDVYACGTTTTEHIGKWMSRGDSAHRIGPGRCTWGDWPNGGMSKRGRQPCCGISKMRKPWMFMFAAPQPINVLQNGWREEIQRIE